MQSSPTSTHSGSGKVAVHTHTHTHSYPFTRDGRICTDSETDFYLQTKNSKSSFYPSEFLGRSYQLLFFLTPLKWRYTYTHKPYTCTRTHNIFLHISLLIFHSADATDDDISEYAVIPHFHHSKSLFFFSIISKKNFLFFGSFSLFHAFSHSFFSASHSLSITHFLMFNFSVPKRLHRIR